MVKNLAPVTNRIELLDVIRGFALIGILFANILSWSGIKFLDFNTIISFGNIEDDRMLYDILKYFIDTKFYTIFSLLFGIGFSLQISRNKDNPAFPPLYARRLGLLILIGLSHALIWSGDILVLYALMGFIMLTIRNISQSMQLKMALLLFVTPLLLDIIYMYTFASEIPEITAVALKMYPDMSPEEVVTGFQSVNFITVFKMNFHNLIWRWYDFIPSGRPFKVLGLFLLGSYLYSSGYFTSTVKKFKTLIIWLILGFGLTYLSMTLKGGVSSYSKSWSDILYKLIHEVGQISLALSYISIIAILLHKFPKLFLWEGFKAYGRMSLTSYIGQSIIGIFVFYPIIGLEYYGKLSLESIYYFGLVILIGQIAFSMLWFRWFKFGPIEWVWRCATYKKIFPILKE
ncbi:MAG: DUF418 domain-containing protein [Candidatus Neomarinimicrobiota bacterium]|nr:MAG: DUF418 domain-containing protein [Candidatus Neomarinimicrobiota bacterium]